jgi:sugar/nucleoside kinase (ribokinase family)
VVVEMLAQAGVDTSAVIRDPDAPTGVSVGLVDDDDRAMLTATGALSRLRAADVPRGLIAAARHVHVSSPFLQDGLRPGLAALTANARSASLDPGWDPRERWDVALDGFDVLLPNAQEALALAGRGDGGAKAARGVADAEAAARHLARDRRMVVVKLGPEGALAVRDGEAVRVRAPVVDAVDGTGAGDSFDAGFLAAHLRGDDLADALALGCACGALSTRRPGGTAAQPTLEEARALA